MCGFLICVKFTCRCCGSGSCAWPVQGLSDRGLARCLFVPNGVRLAVLDCALFFCVRLFSSGIRWSGLFAEPATRSFVWQKKFLRHKPAAFSYFFLASAESVALSYGAHVWKWNGCGFFAGCCQGLPSHGRGRPPRGPGGAGDGPAYKVLVLTKSADFNSSCLSCLRLCALFSRWFVGGQYFRGFSLILIQIFFSFFSS